MSTPCTACEVGKFKEAEENGFDNTQDDCAQCHNDRTTLGTGSTSGNSCLCKVGTTGPNSSWSGCTACAIGKFKSTISNNSCESCHADRTTASSGSSSDNMCICAAGSYQTQEGNKPCVSCESGKFIAAAGAIGACTSCHADRVTSGIGSSSGTACVCKAGKFGTAATGDDGASTACTQCDAGKLKLADGNGSSNSSSDCDSSCTAGQHIATDNASCKASCSPDFSVAAGGVASSFCATACPLGFKVDGSSCVRCSGETEFQNLLSQTTCQTCSTDSSVDNVQTAGYGDAATPTAHHTCGCPKGYAQQTTGAAKDGSGHNCLKCGTGKYMNEISHSTSTCKDCAAIGAVTITVAGAIAEDADLKTECKCGKGKTGVVGNDGNGTCNDCATGKYKNVAGDNACTTCAANTYADSVGSSECTACNADRSTSGTGGAAPESCLCNTGKYGNSGANDACTQCPIGKMKAAIGDNVGDCVACADASHYVSLSSTSCIVSCESGELQVSTQTHGKSCVTACPAGFVAGPDSTCTSCNLASVFHPDASAGSCKSCATTSSGDTVLTAGFGDVTDLNGDTANHACGCPLGYMQSATGAEMVTE